MAHVLQRSIAVSTTADCLWDWLKLVWGGGTAARERSVLEHLHPAAVGPRHLCCSALGAGDSAERQNHLPCLLCTLLERQPHRTLVFSGLPVHVARLCYPNFVIPGACPPGCSPSMGSPFFLDDIPLLQQINCTKQLGWATGPGGTLPAAPANWSLLLTNSTQASTCLGRVPVLKNQKWQKRPASRSILVAMVHCTKTAVSSHQNLFYFSLCIPYCWVLVTEIALGYQKFLLAYL